MAIATASITAPKNQPKIVVTTLGTGTPVLDPNRFSQSILVEAGGHRLLFDVGRGAALRLTQAGVPPALVEHVFFTHYHSDHTVGFADFWLVSWLPGGGGRTAPMSVIGPPGVEALIQGHRIAFADDIRIRVADQKLPRQGVEIDVTTFDGPGTVFEKDGVVVTAFASDHGALIQPNYGYRIEFEGRSVTISGDAKKDVNVAKMATGTDLLLHSVGAARQELKVQPHIQRILDHHITPQEAGEIFAMARPGLAALTHMVLLERPGFPALNPDEVIDMVREVYDGPIVLAQDLMRFEISDEVVVLHPRE